MIRIDSEWYELHLCGDGVVRLCSPITGWTPEMTRQFRDEMNERSLRMTADQLDAYLEGMDRIAETVGRIWNLVGFINLEEA